MLIATLLLLLPIAPAQAQATRTWVSGVGDDANPCSRTAPCKTFAGAISKTATGGQIDCLDSGGFGAVTIVKSITIDCGYTGGISAAGTTGVIVNATNPSATASIVILRNFTIDGFGSGIDGIRMIAGGALHIENMRIMNMTGQGIEIATTNGSDIFVRDTIVSGAIGGGILLAPGAGGSIKASLDNVRMERNGGNVAAFGLKAQSGAAAVVTNSTASRNFGNGFETTAGAAIALTFSTVSLNAGTGLAASTGSIRMANVTIASNFLGLSGNVISFKNNYNTANGTAGDPSQTVDPQ